ncbi:MAG TPA: type I phosphomannose isomerase catalytic subunit [Candidatus Dormibacteraeota bacterium]|nr:type I phosphomannose isomerase catalytic subunit [Candidatus Dormibacteraeota bacterium]
MASEPLYPYLLEPKETTAIWGGESWKCWDENRVRNGALAGMRVAQLRESLGSRLLGTIDSGRIFPILTKIITARDWLSVQVHPDDAYAQRVEHQANGKVECWYVFSAQQDAQIVLGWTRDTSREEYERRVADGTLGELLRRVPVKAGDAFYLPAGTLHAIGGGIVLFETQQASDLTYRIFDWNRVGLDGVPRPLHVRKAADVLEYRAETRGAVEPVKYVFESLQRTIFIADPRFLVERIVARDEPSSVATHDRPLVIMALERSLTISCGDSDVTLAPFDTALVPAGAGRCAICANEGDEAPFMFVTPPPDERFVAAQLLAAGIEQTRVDRFLEQF